MAYLLLILKYCLATRATLAAESLALRQQFAALKRHATRPKLTRRDPLFWVLFRRVWSGWRDSLVPVNLSTVLGWHR